MTIYQEEMQRKAQRYGCITDYDEADQLLLISHKGVHLTAVNPEGFMFYNSKELTDPESREVFSHLVDDAETVREYVGLYESSPQMKPKDVQNYRKLSEYEILISVAILIGSTLGIGFLAAKIYRVGVLMYGTTPKLGAILKAVWKA